MSIRALALECIVVDDKHAAYCALRVIADDLLMNADADDRIVLLVPERVRVALGWPERATPAMIIGQHELIFAPPAR